LATIADADPQVHNHPLDYTAIQQAITSSVSNKLNSISVQECIDFPLHVDMKEWVITSDLNSKRYFGHRGTLKEN
jgi:hypothetical protein